MRNTLLVTFAWPPNGTAGVHRPLRFARHLPDVGWEPTILAAKPIVFARYDPDLCTKIPEGIEVYWAGQDDPWLRFKLQRMMTPKTSNLLTHHSRKTDTSSLTVSKLITSRLKRIARSAVDWVEPRAYHPDLSAGWIKPAVDIGAGILRTKQYDAIWATGGPWSTLVVGYKLSIQSKVPLVIDLRDGWTLTHNHFRHRRPKWAIEWDKKRLASFFRHAQSVVLLHEYYAEAYLHHFKGALDAKKIHLIPNGFDDEEVALSGKTKESLPNSKLRILHAGTMANRRFDTLLAAIEKLPQEEVGLLEIVFLGENPPELASAVHKKNLKATVRLIPPVPYKEVREWQESSHVLLVLGEFPVRGYELFVGSKVYQYLALKRPVLGILPNNASKLLLEYVKSELVANVDDVVQIQDVLMRIISAWKSNTLETLVPDWHRCRTFTASSQANDLSLALSGRPPKRSYSLGDVDIPESLKY